MVTKKKIGREHKAAIKIVRCKKQAINHTKKRDTIANGRIAQIINIVIIARVTKVMLPNRGRETRAKKEIFLLRTTTNPI